MTCQKCGEDLCICPSVSSSTTLYLLPPLTEMRHRFGLTKEEFGIDRFDAIKAASGRVRALQTAHLYVKKGKPRMAQEYVSRADGLARELIRLFGKGTITPEDTKHILTIDAQAPVPPVITHPRNTSKIKQNDLERGDPTPAPISARLLPNPALND